MLKYLRILTLASILAGPAIAPALAHDHQHEGDIIVGRILGTPDQLAMEADLDEPVFCEPSAVPGLNGWLKDEPGLEALMEDEPDEGFYMLQPGAQVRLEVVSLDAGIKVWNPELTQMADAVGEWIDLGDHELHTHMIWHLDSDVLGTGWEGTLHGTFKLVDVGTTGYTQSESFDMAFTNVPEPMTVGLLVLGGLVMGRRMRGGRQP